MNREPPAHKQTDPAKLPGQVAVDIETHTASLFGVSLVGVTTGRMSSSDPNLQNIPIRTPEGRRVRGAIYGTTPAPARSDGPSPGPAH